MAIIVYRITAEGFARVTADGASLRIIEEFPTAIVLFTPNAKDAGDISTIWQTPLGHADWEMAGPLLRAGADLDTSLLISLFSDRTAAADDAIPDGTNDRRGWWGDNTLGSRLWLLDRGKLTTATALDAKNYIVEALQWMLDDGVAATINVQTAIQLPNILAAQIDIFRQDGSRLSRNFAWVWQQVT